MRRSILLAFPLLPALALASGYSLPPTNPRDLGMSGATTAAQNDAGAALALPAALAKLNGPSVRVGADLLNLFETWSDPDGAAPDTEIDLRYVPLPTIFAGYGGKLAALGNRGWGVGAGLDPFGGGAVFWPDGWAGQYRILSVDRQVLRTFLTAGVEVLPRLRIGGGLVYYYTMETFEQQFCQSCVNPALPDATATLELSGGAFSYDVSAEFEAIPDVLTFAVDYKHKATQALEGDATWEGVNPALAAQPGLELLNDQDVSQDLTIPNLLNIGVAYRASPPLLVTFTYTLDRWVVYDADRFIGTEISAVTGEPVELVVDRQYRNGYTLRAGAEYDVSPAFQVRAGLQRDVSGMRTSTYSPSLPDGSSWAGSLGATFKFGSGFSADAGVFFGLTDEVTSTENGEEPSLGSPLPTGTFRGDYDISALIYGVSIAWNPGAARAP